MTRYVPVYMWSLLALTTRPFTPGIPRSGEWKRDLCTIVTHLLKAQRCVRVVDCGHPAGHGAVSGGGEEEGRKTRVN